MTSLVQLFPSVADRSPMRLPSKRATFGNAVNDLFHQRFAGLHRYIGRLSGDTNLAEDVVQEAFCRLFDRGELPDEPVAWLVAVASNLLRDECRNTGRRLRLLERTNDTVGHSARAIEPDALVLRSERQRQVREALDRLSPRDREALLLRHSGFSYREIAAALAMSETSVGTTLLRAGAAFRASYQELHGEPD